MLANQPATRPRSGEPYGLPSPVPSVAIATQVTCCANPRFSASSGNVSRTSPSFSRGPLPPPAPLATWQTAHCCAYTSAPSARMPVAARVGSSRVPMYMNTQMGRNSSTGITQ